MICFDVTKKSAAIAKRKQKRFCGSRPLFLALSLCIIAPVTGWAENPSGGAAQESGTGSAPGPAHALAMHGTPKYPADFKHFDYVNPEAPKGGTIKLAAQGTFDSFNPFIIKGNPARAVVQIYNTLGKTAEDEAFTFYGSLAKSIETPEDRSWVEFTLREEARWHDGQAVTVEDVIWTLETLRTKGSPLYRFYYASVEKAEKTGPRKVKFSFKDGENRELPLILAQFPILPKHWWEKRNFEDALLEPPLGSGPYKIGKFKPGRYLELERVEDYWGKDLSVNVGQYNFQRIRYDYYRDSTVMIEAFKGGEFDFRRENSAKAWSTDYNIPQVERGQIVKEEIPTQRTSGLQGFVFNLRKDMFKDPKVREALAYGFDFEWSRKNLFHGLYHRTRSYFDNSELAATGLPSGEEKEILEQYRGRLPDPRLWTEEYNPPQSDGSGNIRANQRKALELLKEAGWTIGKDRKLAQQSSGKRMAFEILIQSPLMERVVLPFKKNLERIGVDVTVRQVDSAQYRRRVETFDYDMIVDVFAQSMSPGNEQREFWGSKAADSPLSSNSAGLKDPIVDELVELVIAAPDRESLVQRVRALDRVLQWHFLVIPQFHSKATRVVYWNKFGHPDVIPMRGLVINAWWVDPEKEKTLESGQRSPKQ